MEVFLGLLGPARNQNSSTSCEISFSDSEKGVPSNMNLFHATQIDQTQKLK